MDFNLQRSKELHMHGYDILFILAVYSNGRIQGAFNILFDRPNKLPILSAYQISHISNKLTTRLKGKKIPKQQESLH